MNAFLQHGTGTTGPFSTEQVPCRERGNPRPRLTRDGYTKRGGSPTRFEVLHAGRWRRVYVVCFSNTETLFVKTAANPFLVITL